MERQQQTDQHKPKRDRVHGDHVHVSCAPEAAEDEPDQDRRRRHTMGLLQGK